MASPSPEARGEALADEHWRDDLRFVVLHAPPLRAGRGRSKSQANRKGLRAETWSRELECLSFEGKIARELRDGSLEPAEARRQVDDAGWGKFIQVAATRPELVAACAHFFGQGFTLWQVNEAPGPGLPLSEMSFLLLTDARRM